MKVFHIVASMMTILAILFLFAPVIRKREIAKTQLERDYFKLLSEYKNNQSTEVLEQLTAVGMKLFNLKDKELANKKVNEDLQQFGA